MQLRISASQIESLNILRQFLIQKRAELYDLPSHFPKSFQIVFIIKAEGLISGHRQPYFFLPGKYDRCIFQIWRFPAQRQKPIHIYAFFYLLCQKLHLFFQVFNFFRRYQPQMTAFHAAILHDRQIAQATDMQLRLYSWG